jgi:hypothetical protein
MKRLRRARKSAIVGLGVTGLVLLALAIVDGDGATAFTAVFAVIGALLAWLEPEGKPRHPPTESTIQWIRKSRREQR